MQPLSRVRTRVMLAFGLALHGGLATLSAQAPTPPATPPPPAVPEPETTAPSFAGEITVVASPSLTIPSPEAARAALAAVPGGTNFIDATHFEEARTSTLKDALDFAPGVFVQPRFGAEEARLSIRGSGLQRTFHGRGLKLLQDGVPLNLADGSFDFQAVEPLAARYVEIHRGANGLEYGSSTLGGAINFVSRNGHEASELQGRFEGGSFGYLRAQASSGAARGDFDYYATVAQFAQDGFRDHSRQNTQRLFSNFGYRADENLESRLYVTAVHSDSELPGSLTRAQLDADPTRAAAGNLALDQKRDFDLLRLANKTTFELRGGNRLEASSFFSYKHLDHPIFQVLDQLSRDVGGELRYHRESRQGEPVSTWVVGLAPGIGWVDDRRFVNVGGRRGNSTARGTTTSRNLDLYAENRRNLLPTLTLSAGLQTSLASREFEDSFRADGDQSDQQDFTGWSPKLGLLWRAGRDVAWFVSAARSFEPPSFGELVNVGGRGLVALDAQTSTSVEVGSRGARGLISWDAVAYRAWLDGEMLSLNDGQGNPLGTTNAGRTLHSGAEIGLEVGPLEIGGGATLQLRQTYLWSRFVFDGDPTYGDNQLAGLPEHFLRTELDFRHRGGAYGGPHLEWSPSRYPVDHANTLFADGYAIFGIKLGFHAQHGLGIFIDGRNLTDVRYAATTGVLADARGRDSAQFLPGDGRSVFVGVDFRR